MASFRITMGMKMNSYRYNLMQSTNTLNSSMEKVQTNRKFNSYAESPADATHAWRIRREFMDNYSYQRNNTDTYTRFQTAWLTAGSVKTRLEDLVGRTSIIRGANGATGSAKRELGNILHNASDSIIQAMNGAKYGEEFVFSGTNGTDPPFAWTEDKKLTYRGIVLDPPAGETWSSAWGWGEFDEETGMPADFLAKYEGVNQFLDSEAEANARSKAEKELEDLQKNLAALQEAFDTYKKDHLPAEDAADDVKDAYNKDLDALMKPIKAAADAVRDQEHVIADLDNKEKWFNYFKNINTLNTLSEEKQYADLGLGMKENEQGQMIDSTIFNSAIPGINMLGYGIDADGDPKNLVLLMNKIGDVLERVQDGGEDGKGEGLLSKEDEEELFRLMKKFDSACERTLKGYTDVDTQGAFLQANGTTLEDQGVNLNTQILDLEQVDMADAITAFMWDYNCYSAGLKIGTQLLSQSLLDYMR